MGGKGGDCAGIEPDGGGRFGGGGGGSSSCDIIMTAGSSEMSQRVPDSDVRLATGDDGGSCPDRRRSAAGMGGRRPEGDLTGDPGGIGAESLDVRMGRRGGGGASSESCGADAGVAGVGIGGRAGGGGASSSSS